MSSFGAMADDEGFMQQGRRRNARNKNNVFQGSHPARDLEETTYQVLGPKAGFNHINTCVIIDKPVKSEDGCRVAY